MGIYDKPIKSMIDKKNLKISIIDESKKSNVVLNSSDLVEKRECDFGYCEGTFVNGLLYGDGLIYMNCGISFSGAFINGLLNGHGKIEFDTGTIYEGKFVNNLLNGYGKIHFSSGLKYEGTFVDNILNGYGTITKEYGTVCEGVLVNGSLLQIK